MIFLICWTAVPFRSVKLFMGIMNDYNMNDSNNDLNMSAEEIIRNYKCCSMINFENLFNQEIGKQYNGNADGGMR